MFTMEKLLEVIPHLQDITDFQMPENTHSIFQVPVMMLRFSQNTFSAKACFSSSPAPEDCRSMYETLDELIRGRLLPSDLPALAVEFHEGKLWSVDNRWLVVLKCLQACRQDETVWAPCQVNHSKKRFRDHFDTTADGLSIVPRLASEDSLHLGGPIFNPARQGIHSVKRFSEKHPAIGTSFLHMVKVAASLYR